MHITSMMASDAYPEIIEVITQAYQSLGYPVSIIKLPAKRALSEANTNPLIDAELARTALAETVLINHLKIPVPIKEVELSVFINRADLNDLTELNEYNMGTVRGLVVIEEQLKHFNFTALNSIDQTLALLNNHRLELAILPKKAGLYFSQKLGYETIVALEPPMGSYRLYHFLHKKHQALLPELTLAIEKFSQIPTQQPQPLTLQPIP